MRVIVAYSHLGKLKYGIYVRCNKCRQMYKFDGKSSDLVQKIEAVTVVKSNVKEICHDDESDSDN
jgi:hypothetical protein